MENVPQNMRYTLLGFKKKKKKEKAETKSLNFPRYGGKFCLELNTPIPSLCPATLSQPYRLLGADELHEVLLTDDQVLLITWILQHEATEASVLSDCGVDVLPLWQCVSHGHKS